MPDKGSDAVKPVVYSPPYRLQEVHMPAMYAVAFLSPSGAGGAPWHYEAIIMQQDTGSAAEAVEESAEAAAGAGGGTSDSVADSFSFPRLRHSTPTLPTWQPPDDSGDEAVPAMQSPAREVISPPGAASRPAAADAAAAESLVLDKSLLSEPSPVIQTLVDKLIAGSSSYR